ncbi:hypothetical protein [Amycolatopsis sp. lyj-112]|uniref:hypothetical protein n=1 Tax=Amycolatopsis sp. lyj-112 TaxID=2789288 RepID=UPI00397C0F83
MMLEIVIMVGIAGRCVLDLVQAATYRWRIRARTSLLAAVATLPAGAEVSEHAGGNTWRVSVARNPGSEAA